jgi:hypothetical protein
LTFRLLKLILIFIPFLSSCKSEELTPSSIKTIILTSRKDPKIIFHSVPKAADYHTMEMYYNETPAFKYYVDRYEFELMNSKEFINWLKIGDTIRLQITNQDYEKIYNYKNERLPMEDQMIKVYGIHSKHIVFLSLDKVLSKHNERKSLEPINLVIIIFLLLFVLLHHKVEHFVRLKFRQLLFKK